MWQDEWIEHGAGGLPFGLQRDLRRVVGDVRGWCRDRLVGDPERGDGGSGTGVGSGPDE